jgi:CheY-like chemotaxis protein
MTDQKVTAQKSFSVLLIDDDPDTRNMFQMVMEYHNLNLAVAEDAETAFDYLRTHSPDVIVLDIMLPGIDGYQALNQIQQSKLAPGASVVATTAYYTTDTPQELLSRGFSGYLPKPLNPSTLVPYLQRILGHV